MCRDGTHLSLFTHGIITNGGEGTILRKSHSQYHPGRSKDLIKFKVNFGYLLILLFIFIKQM